MSPRGNLRRSARSVARSTSSTHENRIRARDRSMTWRATTFNPEELADLSELPRWRGCDFCATDLPVWAYPATTTALGRLVQGDTHMTVVAVGDWKACTVCSQLIESRDWPALARRTLESLGPKRIGPV